MLRLIEELSMNAWPSLQTMVYDGWILRFANGYTRRANSVNPLYSSARDVYRKIEHCETLYQSKNLNIVFKMTSEVYPEILDQLLSRIGYKDDAYTSVRVLELNNDLQKSFTQPLIVTNFPDEDWVTNFCRLNNICERNSVTLKKMLENIIPKKCFASIQLDNKVIACGMGVLEHDFIGVFDIVVDVNYRNQGYGRQLILNLLRWGKVNGAKNAYLQVMLDNLPALKLYSNLGFQEIYKYWYRIKIQDIKLSSFLKERTQFPISFP